MSTGVIGIVKYLGYYFPGMRPARGCVSRRSLVTALVVFALYRNVAAIGKLAELLWVVMLLSVGAVTLAAFTRFHPHLAFTYPDGAFRLSRRFFAGMGAGLVIAVYDYLGYNTIAYMGDELRDPGRVMPRAILYSILGMMVIYLTMNVSVVGAVPWQQIASVRVGRLPGARAGVGRRGGEGLHRPHRADRVRFARGGAPRRLAGSVQRREGQALLRRVRAAPPDACSFLTWRSWRWPPSPRRGRSSPSPSVIDVLTAVFVLVQSIAQIAALTVLRRRQPTLKRPIGWFSIPSRASSPWPGGSTSMTPRARPILLSFGWVAVGGLAFLGGPASSGPGPLVPRNSGALPAPGREGAAPGEVPTVQRETRSLKWHSQSRRDSGMKWHVCSRLLRTFPTAPLALEIGAPAIGRWPPRAMPSRSPDGDRAGAAPSSGARPRGSPGPRASRSVKAPPRPTGSATTRSATRLDADRFAVVLSPGLPAPRYRIHDATTHCAVLEGTAGPRVLQAMSRAGTPLDGRPHRSSALAEGRYVVVLEDGSHSRAHRHRERRRRAASFPSSGGSSPSSAAARRRRPSPSTTPVTSSVNRRGALGRRRDRRRRSASPVPEREGRRCRRGMARRGGLHQVRRDHVRMCSPWS